MTLTTHIVVAGAAGAAFTGNPLGAFFAAVLSHFFVDAIPHWGWPIKSISEDPQNPLKGSVSKNPWDIVRDFFVAGVDGSIGAVILAVIAIFAEVPIISFWFVAVVIGGILPDALQFVYFLYKKEPLVTLQRFHSWIQHHDIPSERYIFGPLMQLPVLVIAIILFFLLV